MPDLTRTPPTIADLPLEDQVLAGLRAVRQVAPGPIPAPVDELQRTAMATGRVEWQPRSRRDRWM